LPACGDLLESHLVNADFANNTRTWPLSPQTYQIISTLALAALLFYPVRQLIWVLSVRRAESRDGQHDEVRRSRFKRRATATSILLCFAFALLFTNSIMKGAQ
jgi:hypothetical protein